MAGTPIFTAPEVIEGKRYDDSCDIFSVIHSNYIAWNNVILFNLW